MKKQHGHIKRARKPRPSCPPKTFQDLKPFEKKIVVGIFVALGLLTLKSLSALSQAGTFSPATLIAEREAKEAIRTYQAPGETPGVLSSSTEVKVKEFNTAALPDYCQPKEYAELTKKMYMSCVKEGMSYFQVGNMIGYPGEQKASSGSIEIWGWNGQGDFGSAGYMSVTFVNGKMSSKAQHGLSDNYVDR